VVNNIHVYLGEYSESSNAELENLTTAPQRAQRFTKKNKPILRVAFVRSVALW
jgi:hypothetical protein